MVETEGTAPLMILF